ncbi:uncharacterized protein LOC123548454 [Mercenaria mercenaria]|uniref:uncharacterized protein LOC123548454 n=1 Tax=Mercenaria mercenaria TaxID=6596 RepID=UPI00234E38DA|nr:uncharacterized protein LOC123548454 [Mercenaria mercenaria]XP_053402353.1 uncharacterized protein LOC123548454 [Mercenaria mercenaria]
MFHTPDYYHNVSTRLSEVLGDIGVNENMVLKRRSAALLRETMKTINIRTKNGSQFTAYNLGSQSEGTTTRGLQSDIDSLFCLDQFILIQDWSEWTPGKCNFLIIQDETTPPGYCLLQRLRLDAPLPTTHETPNFYVKDTHGRILLKNKVIDAVILEGFQRQGPSTASVAEPGNLASDSVAAFPCKSWPQSSRACLDRQDTNIWLTAEIKRYAKSTKCFVVGAGSRASENADFEWRLSTSLAEQCLMFNLNITQIRCYILMKMILKTYINVENLNNESYISSFMCKTVLFHCIASKPASVWKECNILNCLNFCIFTLNNCILNERCPHFIVRENNLMAEKISAEVKQQLLERVSNFIPCDGISLFGIQIDDLGERLQIKLNMINEVHHHIPQPDEYTMSVTSQLLEGTAASILETQEIGDGNLETLLQQVMQLTTYYRDGNMLEKTACRLLTPLLCTSIGSLIASQNIQINRIVSPQTLTWLEAGLDSDVASSRLKLASIMYCVGNAEITALILSYIEEQYNIEVTEPVCSCHSIHSLYIKRGFGQLSSQYGVEALKYIVTFCVKFYPGEINCAPHELQYEMFRSTQEDLQHRGEDDAWMDCAVVDSLPYLYFLQYKTYSNLQRPEEQQQALNKLMWVIETEDNLGHRETALNLLGQCMEQENRPADAIQCYMLSLSHRERNNAARIHICRCLANTIS